MCVGGVALATIMAGCGRSAEQKASEAENLCAKTQMLLDQRSFVEARHNVSGAISLYADLKEDSSLAEAYMLMAECQRQLGEYDSSLFSYRAAVEKFHTLGHNKPERRAKLALAQFYYSISDYTAAYEVARDVAAAAKIYSSQTEAFQALVLRAKASHGLGQYDAEIKTLEVVIQIDSQVYRAANRIDLMKQLFRAYVQAGHYAQARGVLGEWKNYAIAHGDTQAVVRAYYEWGNYQRSLSHPDTVLDAFSDGLGLLNRDMDGSIHIDLLSAVGSLSYSSQRFNDARMFYSDALHWAERAKNLAMEQLLKLVVIACDWKTSSRQSVGAQPELVERCSEILRQCREAQFRQGEVAALFLLGRLTEASGNDSAAVKNYNGALQVYEQTPDIPADEYPGVYLIDNVLTVEKSGWFEAPLQIYAKTDRVRDVFDLLERKNLRDLTEFFLNLPLSTTDESLNQLIQAIQWKQRTLELLARDIWDELAAGKGRSVERLDLLIKSYPRRLSELSAILDQIKARSQNFQRLFSPKPPELNYIQAAIPRDGALLEYTPLANGLTMVVILKDTAYLVKTQIGSQRIIALVNEYNRLIGDPRLHGNSPRLDEAAAILRISELSPVLYGILIGPIAPMLKTVSRLYIVPPLESGFLPFHTLRAGGSSLIEQVNVSYLPSAAALLFSSKEERSVQNVVGLGHQGRTNWDVEYELKNIRSFYKEAQLLFDTLATPRHLKETRYEALHVAAEFNLDRRTPVNSSIVLSDGLTPYGLSDVSLGELFKVTVPQTFLFSNVSPTAGGLSRYAPIAFLANGSRVMVATMWQGERKAKKYFGEIFYTNLLAGMSATDAYHKAMVALVRRPEFSHSYRWGLYYQFGR